MNKKMREMDNILERMKAGEVLVADGAMGTMLFERGLQSGECPELLNLTKPEVVEEIARLYVEAGAQIVETNTFGGSPIKLANYGLDAQTEEINRQGVVLAKRGAVRGAEMIARAARIGTKSDEVPGKRVSEKIVFFSGSCGPSGRILKPYGDAEPQELYDSFARQIKALIDGGADVICVETMTDLKEAVIAVKAAKDLSPSMPVMATMTFDETPKGFYTIMGTGVKDACTWLEKVGADIIGSNCGNGIEKMVRIAREFRRFSSLPLIIQSNAGLPETRDGSIFYSETPEFFAEKAKELVEAGVSIIGGCCGTTPDHIRAIRNALQD